MFYSSKYPSMLIDRLRHCAPRFKGNPQEYLQWAFDLLVQAKQYIAARDFDDGLMKFEVQFVVALDIVTSALHQGMIDANVSCTWA
jgi:hypothetical protein